MYNLQSDDVFCKCLLNPGPKQMSEQWKRARPRWGAAREASDAEKATCRTKQARHDKLQDVNYITQLRHNCKLCFVNLSLSSLPLGVLATRSTLWPGAKRFLRSLRWCTRDEFKLSLNPFFLRTREIITFLGRGPPKNQFRNLEMFCIKVFVD